MNVLSLFDGISVGQLAMGRAVLPITNYYASEIDKVAMSVTKNNFPNTIFLGDVKDWRSWDIDWERIDLLFAGFPCQSWSIAGKQLGKDDPRGELVYVLVDILNHLRSVNKKFHFLIENVKMKNEHLEFINSLLACKPIELNSSYVSPQNRVRYYWTNISITTKLENKLIPLSSILETSGNFEIMDQNKADFLLKLASLPSKERKYIYKNKKDIPNIQISVPKGSFIYSNHLGQNGKLFKGLAATLTCNHPGNVTFHDGNNLKIRKLTPIECERLQTLPDNYTKIDETTNNRYKCIGNSWTCDIIVYILSNLNLGKLND